MKSTIGGGRRRYLCRYLVAWSFLGQQGRRRGQFGASLGTEDWVQGSEVRGTTVYLAHLHNLPAGKVSIGIVVVVVRGGAPAARGGWQAWCIMSRACVTARQVRQGTC